MESIKALRGFRDVYGEEVEKFRLIESVSRHYLGLLGYREIQIPALEKTELFKRSIGDTTDIVEKEMFTFTDRSGDSVTLRPEGTAGVVRAYLQASFYAQGEGEQAFHHGPHVPPREAAEGQVQAVLPDGRGGLRRCRAHRRRRAYLDDPAHSGRARRCTSYAIEINSVGCKDCRGDFRQALTAFLEDRRERLCEDCTGQARKKSPCVSSTARYLNATRSSRDAPVLFDYLCGPNAGTISTNASTRSAALVFPSSVNKRLVRGLDYYTRTVFEVTSSELGAQKAFVAGGATITSSKRWEDHPYPA